jgi:hypothetical protein
MLGSLAGRGSTSKSEFFNGQATDTAAFLNDRVSDSVKVSASPYEYGTYTHLILAVATVCIYRIPRASRRALVCRSYGSWSFHEVHHDVMPAAGL